MKKRFFILALILSFAVSPAFAQPYANTAANSTSTLSRASNDQTLMDYSGSTSGYPIYVGKALKGELTSSGNWRICKATDSANGPTVIQCTDGIWDNRAALSYS